MITYSVKKSKKTRLTFRIFGIFLILFGGCQMTMFFMGYATGHLIGTIFCFLLFLYGLYMVIHSFRKQAYDIVYEFDEEELRIKHYRGTTTYPYADIDDITIIVPDNENVYSLLHITTKKDKFLIPFSYKKQVCDMIYAHVNARITSGQIEKDSEADA